MILLPSYIISASFLHSKRTLLKFGGMRVSTDTFNREEGTVDASSSLEDLLLHVKSLSAVNRRAISAVVGAAVADAASRPMHWLYDRTKLEDIVGHEDPAFWHESVSPFYTLPTGRRSCYNDLGFCMLRSLHPHSKMSQSAQGGFDREAFILSMSEMFSEGSEYSEALKRRIEAYDPARRLEERQPVDGPWQQGAVVAFMEHVNKEEIISGSPDSKETDGLCVSIPLICRLAAESAATSTSTSGSDSESIIQQAAILLSSNPFALEHTYAASRTLSGIILLGDSAGTFTSIRHAALSGRNQELEKDFLLEEMGEVSSSLLSREHHTDAVQRWGRQCANPGSFMGAILAVCSSTQDSARGDVDPSSLAGGAGFSKGIRMVIKGGGCNCSRSNLAGALLGAHYGLEYPTQLNGEQKDLSSGIGGEKVGFSVIQSVPLEWMKKTDKMKEILYLAIERVACL